MVPSTLDMVPSTLDPRLKDTLAGSHVRRKHIKHNYGGPQLSRQKQFSLVFVYVSRNFTVYRTEFLVSLLPLQK